MQVKNPHLKKMNEVEIYGIQAIRKVIATIESNYSRAPFFQEYGVTIHNALLSMEDQTSIFDINLRLITVLFDLLGIKMPQIIKASTIYTGVDRNERIIEACKATQKKYFLNGWGKSNEVHDLMLLKNCGIEFIGLDKNRIYDLVNNYYLLEGLSILHILFMHGDSAIKQSLSYIREVYLYEIDRQRDCI